VAKRKLSEGRGLYGCGTIWRLNPRAAKRLGIPKIRPWIILQDENFAVSSTEHVVCYLTGCLDEEGKRKPNREGFVELLRDTDNKLDKDSFICCDHLYTIQEDDLASWVGFVDPADPIFQKIHEKLRSLFNL